jgi:hypothetical protein
MFVMFEVSAAATGRAENLLSAEVLDETDARVMTKHEADQLGLPGAEVNRRGGDRLYVRVAKQHQRMIASLLETSPDVADFVVYDLDS